MQLHKSEEGGSEAKKWAYIIHSLGLLTPGASLT